MCDNRAVSLPEIHSSTKKQYIYFICLSSFSISSSSTTQNVRRLRVFMPIILKHQHITEFKRFFFEECKQSNVKCMILHVQSANRIWHSLLQTIQNMLVVRLSRFFCWLCTIACTRFSVNSHTMCCWATIELEYYCKSYFATFSTSIFMSFIKMPQILYEILICFARSALRQKCSVNHCHFCFLPSIQPWKKHSRIAHPKEIPLRCTVYLNECLCVYVCVRVCVCTASVDLYCLKRHFFQRKIVKCLHYIFFKNNEECRYRLIWSQKWRNKGECE